MDDIVNDRQFTLKIGTVTTSFSIPESQLLYELVGNNRPPPEDLTATYRRALDHPIDSPPLRQIVKPGERVVITVSDITRGWQRNDLTLPLLDRFLKQRSGFARCAQQTDHRRRGPPAKQQGELAELCTQGKYATVSGWLITTPGIAIIWCITARPAVVPRSPSTV